VAARGGGKRGVGREEVAGGVVWQTERFKREGRTERKAGRLVWGDYLVRSTIKRVAGKRKN